MEEENAIKIKKSSIWKFSTVVLAIALVVVLIVAFNGKGNSNPNGQVVNAGEQQAVNLQVFISNPEIFPAIGPEDAKNVVIEFSDFQCPYCALASGLPEFVNQYATQYADLIGSAGKVQELAEKDELRFIYVPMSFLGQESVYAAQAGLCANKQDKFFEMHDLIFTAHDGQENNGKYSKENLKKIAAKIQGLNTKEFNDCLDKDETLADVQEVASLASQAATGTPTFYVNGQKLSASWSSISASLN